MKSKTAMQFELKAAGCAENSTMLFTLGKGVKDDQVFLLHSAVITVFLHSSNEISEAPHIGTTVILRAGN